MDLASDAILPYLSDRYEQLRYETNHRNRLPPPAARHPDTEASRSLNISPTYMDQTDLFEGQREFIQNWMDQCRKLAHDDGRTVRVIAAHPDAGLVTLAGPRTQQSLAVGRVTFFSVTNDREDWDARAYGYLSELIQFEGDREVPLRTIFSNYGTNLSQDIMVLGNSSKRNNQDGSAGFFGEGVKVAINRLTAAGAVINYYTMDNKWSFTY
ncbi:hypothetical protein HKX48_002143 [Thoreauomyces humboldtii]|nr:hypothetical protein HKX48_002143 [Thoreauomyces humboldtii]